MKYPNGTHEGFIEKTLRDSIARLSNATSDLAIEIVTEVVEAYNESHRVHHAIAHPVSMLHEFSDLCSEHSELADMVDIDLLIWLIIYHDVVYKLLRDPGWNEKESSRFAQAHLQRLGIGEPYASAIHAGIICTMNHEVDSGWNWQDPKHKFTVKILLDLDLSGLGRTPEEFAAETEANWGEYRAVATRDEFDRGRAQWADGFDDSRSLIYHTQVFAGRERKARENLAKLAARA